MTALEQVRAAWRRGEAEFEPMIDEWRDAGGACCAGCYIGKRWHDLVKKQNRRLDWIKVLESRALTDDDVLAAVRAVATPSIPHGPRTASLWDVQAELRRVHPKIVKAKLRSLVRRKLLSGCACGCRGDFEVRS